MASRFPRFPSCSLSSLSLPDTPKRRAERPAPQRQPMLYWLHRCDGGEISTRRRSFVLPWPSNASLSPLSPAVFFLHSRASSPPIPFSQASPTLTLSAISLDIIRTRGRRYITNSNDYQQGPPACGKMDAHALPRIPDDYHASKIHCTCEEKISSLSQKASSRCATNMQVAGTWAQDVGEPGLASTCSCSCFRTILPLSPSTHKTRTTCISDLHKQRNQAQHIRTGCMA